MAGYGKSQITFQKTNTDRMSLFVEEALDGHLRGLLEGLLLQLYLSQLAVVRKLLVRVDSNPLRKVGNRLCVKTVPLDGILVEIDKGDKLGSPVHNHRLADIRLVVDDGLNLLGIDVLTVRRKYH